MGFWFVIMRVATLVNIVLLVAISSMWIRNYLRLRTTFLLGFLVFGGFFLVENAYALYIYMLNPGTREWFADIPEHYTAVLTLLTVLQLGGLLALAWTTRT